MGGYGRKVDIVGDFQKMMAFLRRAIDYLHAGGSVYGNFVPLKTCNTVCSFCWKNVNVSNLCLKVSWLSAEKFVVGNRYFDG